MRPWKIACISLFFSAGLFAQEQLALRINEKGLMKVLEMAVRYNTASESSRTFVIPGGIYKFTIPKKQLRSNPIIEVVNEISDLGLDRDLEFYFQSDDIKINGDVDAKSIKAEVIDSTDQGFDIRLSITLPQVEVSGPVLGLCEVKDPITNGCGNGLKATITNLKIVTQKRPVVLESVLRLRTNENVARLRVMSVKSNLEEKSAPSLAINFNNIQVPPIAIIINGQKTQLDTSRLKEEIMRRRSFLSNKLLNFAADFIAQDLVEMINIYLVNKTIATSWMFYNRDLPLSFNEFLSQGHFLAAQDNTYVRPSLIRPAGIRQSDPIKEMMSQIADLIRHAQVELTLKKVTAVNNKDIELGGLVDFVLNNKSMRVRNTLGNSNRKLPTLDLNKHRDNDVNLAISEPLINGALDLANSTGLFQEIFDNYVGVRGFAIKNVKIHFTSNETFVVVVNSAVDLKELRPDSIAKWFKHKIAAWIERNNNDSVIYFPIQIEVRPKVLKLLNGGVGLNLYVKSPFDKGGLINTFNYPSNVPSMTETVRDGVMKDLKTSLQEYTNKNYNVDLSNFLNQSGVEFRPNMISVSQAAYLLLNLDIVNIKFDSKNPNKR